MVDNNSPTLCDIKTLNEAAERMLGDLELSPLSRQTYGFGVNALIRCLHTLHGDYDAADALAPCPLDYVTEEMLSDFARWLREAYPDERYGAEDATVTRTARTYMVAARRLANWLDLRDLLPLGVSFERMIRRIDQGRGQRRSSYKRRPTDPDVLRVLTHYGRKPLPEKRGARRLALLRNRALMAFLYDTGTRISEALALSRSDVLDGRARKVRLVHTKNGKPRTVFLCDETRDLLRAYTREREDSPFAPLFASHGRGKGTSITPAHAWNLVKQAARAEGLYENTSPHSLRHRRAQDLLDEGMPLQWVAALLGHEHSDTTRVVYAYETDEERLGDMVMTYGLSLSEVEGRASEAVPELKDLADSQD